MDGPPRADTPFQGPANAASQFRMAADNLLENGDWSKAGGCLQHRHDFGVENISERIRPSASSRSLLRGQLRILLDTIRVAILIDAFAAATAVGVGLTELHVEPHLVIG